MRFDTTAIGIILGLVPAGLYAVVRGFRHRSFEVGTTVLCFLSGFAIPGGVYLIVAGMSGKHGDLPSTWREHIAAAGIVVIGLSAQYIFGRMKDSFAHLASRASGGSSPSDSQSDEEGAS